DFKRSSGDNLSQDRPLDLKEDKNGSELAHAN
ncbi:hypothetical protein L195_g030871, partial [Trifolium pratense]